MPRDYAAQQTDKELVKLERKLSLLYSEAKADLDVLVDNYYNGWTEDVWDSKKMEYVPVHHAGMKERYQQEYQAFLDGKYHDPSGKYTDEEMFNRWVWSQEGRGKHIEAMRDAMANNMTQTNQRAAAMINDKTPGIYSLNANWEAYKIEVVRKSDSGRKTTQKNGKTIKGNKLDVAFNLVREQTIKELMTDKNHVEFRVNRVNPKRDYAWNKDQITKALASGILLGESPYKIAERYLVVMQRNKAAAIRNARTSITSAQNAGCQNTYDRAVEMGIKLQKQWMSTRDDRTRDSHILANGQRVDVDKKFSVGGSELMYPGDVSGSPAEVYNCRCTMVTLDPAVLAMNSDPYDVKGFEEWVDEHRPEVKGNENVAQKETPKEGKRDKILSKPLTKSDDQYYDKLLKLIYQNPNIKYNPAEQNNGKSEEEIIKALSGGDRTQGSCASVGLAYVGQKNGINVLDFRDGMSRYFFSSGLNLYALSKAKGIKALHYGEVTGKSSCTLANNFLKTCEKGKEYYLCVGRHAAVVRKVERTGISKKTGKETTIEQLQYLELQSATNSGWTNFNGNPRYTLTHRFGCSSASGHGEKWDFMMNITDSDFNNDEFRSLLGYINTAENEQVKGKYGTIK